MTINERMKIPVNEHKHTGFSVSVYAQSPPLERRNSKPKKARNNLYSTASIPSFQTIPIRSTGSKHVTMKDEG